MHSDVTLPYHGLQSLLGAVLHRPCLKHKKHIASTTGCTGGGTVKGWLPNSVGKNKLRRWQEGVLFLFLEYLGWTTLRDHPPPRPPSSAPTQTKRVPFCSFWNFASICILNNT